MGMQVCYLPIGFQRKQSKFACLPNLERRLFSKNGLGARAP
jgi:hypothetical protein